MVKFAVGTHWHPPKDSLQQAVASAVGRLRRRLRDKDLTLELDLDPEVRATPCPSGVEFAVQQLLVTAIEHSPPHSELLVSACRTVRGVEIEVADDGPSAAKPSNAFQPCDQAGLLSSDSVRGWLSALEFYCTRCPQGGVAWTIVLPHSLAAVRAA